MTETLQFPALFNQGVWNASRRNFVANHAGDPRLDGQRQQIKRAWGAMMFAPRSAQCELKFALRRFLFHRHRFHQFIDT
uniref:hypothetical protein n=1 Tax=Burkholderia sp. AU33423 TaxID=2015355 RepID=UPI00117D9C75|nr:hypothetical protein [Burkholderia sp. AU33423]